MGSGGTNSVGFTIAPFYASVSQDSVFRMHWENRSATTNADAEIKLVNGSGSAFIGVVNVNGTGIGANTVPGGAHRSFLDISDNTSGSGWDIGGAAAAHTTRFYNGGYTAGNIRATIDVNGLTFNNGTSIQTTATTGLAVANVGANSCGSTAATIAGSNLSNVITVGATSGTQCRVTFSFAAATAWDCISNDSTTTVATRTTPVDTTHTDVFGAFTAGDKVTMHCIAR